MNRLDCLNALKDNLSAIDNLEWRMNVCVDKTLYTKLDAQRQFHYMCVGKLHVELLKIESTENA